MGNVYIGVDLGGTKTAIVLSARPPEVLGRMEFSTLPEQGPRPAIDQIIRSVHTVLDQHNRTVRDIAAIGVSCGSPLDRLRGIVQAPPNMATWIDVPITKLLTEAFGATCRLENDANAGAVAEYLYGAGIGTENMVFLTLGTGLGAGLILNGRLYHGTSDSAGEIGHIRLSRRGPVGYHKAGSVEGWSSGGGIARLGRQMLARAARRGEPSLLANYGEQLTARDIGIAAQAGDALARQVLTRAGERLGETIAILIDMLNPQRIVLGGLALRMGDALLAPMRKIVAREALPQAAKDCTIVPIALGDRIGDVASLCVGLGLDELTSSSCVPARAL